MDSHATSPSTEDINASAIRREELLKLLERAQNPDGGWAFHLGGSSRVEPTCWAVRAHADANAEDAPEITRALDFLKSKQLADGSWPAADGMEAGAWVTSLACSVLVRESQTKANGNQNAIRAGLRWLCDYYPRDSSGWQKFLKKFQSNKHLVAHSDEFRGWGWTPRTSSWVEPTALALMAFADTRPRGQLEKSVAERRALAIRLLYDRMCPRGGWNCGNPRVYGVDGDPLVLPTCWALLALRNVQAQTEFSKSISEEFGTRRALSLKWLEDEFANIQSASSLAMACVTLKSYGVALPQSPRSLLDWSASELMEQGTHTAAWVVIALNPGGSWPVTLTAAAQ